MQRLDGGVGGPGRSFAGGIVALGNFDGFHLGHQAVVGRARSRARGPRGGRRWSRPSIRIRCATSAPTRRRSG